jgi:hypothetical protein
VRTPRGPFKLSAPLAKTVRTHMDQRAEENLFEQGTHVPRPRLKFLTLLHAPVRKAPFAVLRITAEISARCSGCGDGIETSDLACDVSMVAHERPDLRFHHRCYRTWCAS